MKQTAVEFIEEYLRFKGLIINDNYIPQVLIGVINQAKEIEKQQQGYSEEDIKTAFLDGWELRNEDLPFTKAKNKWFKQFKNK